MQYTKDCKNKPWRFYFYVFVNTVKNHFPTCRAAFPLFFTPDSCICLLVSVRSIVCTAHEATHRLPSLPGLQQTNTVVPAAARSAWKQMPSLPRLPPLRPRAEPDKHAEVRYSPSHFARNTARGGMAGIGTFRPESRCLSTRETGKTAPLCGAFTPVRRIGGEQNRIAMKKKRTKSEAFEGRTGVPCVTCYVVYIRGH